MAGHNLPLLRVAVEPAGVRAYLRDAVVAGGGAVVPPAQAEALVWTTPDDGEALRAFLRSHPAVSWVQLPWAGVEPLMHVLDRGRVWTAGQGVYAEPVAEHALALALASLRDLKTRARALAWGRPSGLSLLGARVTIVGAGGIAVSLLRLLQPFGCAVTVVRRRALPCPGATRTLPFTSLREAFVDADVVFLACPLTPETARSVGRRELAALPPHARLVNVARGGVLDTAALVEALANGRIGGAALDVTDPEPLPPDHPLWSLDTCIITPHCANTPEQAVPLLSERVRENVRRRRCGEPLLGMVDLDAGY